MRHRSYDPENNKGKYPKNNPMLMLMSMLYALRVFVERLPKVADLLLAHPFRIHEFIVVFPLWVCGEGAALPGGSWFSNPGTP